MRQLTDSERRIAHRAGMSSDYADRDGDWISVFTGQGPIHVLNAVAGQDITTDFELVAAQVSSSRGGVIVLPATQFITTRPIIITANDHGDGGAYTPIRIVSPPQGSQWIYHPDSTGIYKTSDALTIGDASSTGPVARDVLLQGFELRSGATSADTGSNHGGIVLRRITQVGIHRVNVREFGNGNLVMTNGFALKITDNCDGAGDACQEIDISDSQFTTSYRNVILDGVVNCNWRGVQAEIAASVDVDLLCAVGFSWDGKLIESNAPYGVRAIPRGGVTGGTASVANCTFRHIYNESANTDRKLFYFDGSANPGCIRNIMFLQCIPRMGDFVGCKRWHLNTVWGVTFEGNHAEGLSIATSLYARACRQMYSAPGDIVSEGVLDLDAASAAHFIISGRVADAVVAQTGISIASGAYAPAGVALQVGAGSVGLAQYALGSEPAGAAGRMIFCTTTLRPAVHDGAIWQQLAFIASPEIALGRTMVEYWTTQESSSIGITGGAVQSWVGRVKSTTLSAAAAPNRAVYSASDSDFGGKPSLQFNTSSLELRNLAITNLLLTGQSINVIAVVKIVSIPGVDSSFCRINAAPTQSTTCQTSTASGGIAQAYQTNAAGTIVAAPLKALTTGVHMIAWTSTGANGLTYVDAVPGTAVGSSSAALATNVTEIHLGNLIGGFAAPDFKIVALYLLRDAPTQFELSTALTYAKQVWGF